MRMRQKIKVTLESRQWFLRLFLVASAALWLCSGTGAVAASVSALYARGYTVLPAPQKVELGEADFRFGQDWRLQLGPGVPRSDIAIESLNGELQSRYHVTLSRSEGGPAPAGILRLAVIPNSVSVGDASDRDRNALSEQAYQITLAKDAVGITANSLTGLFYGAQTLIQLLKPQAGSLWLPEGEIVDWPDLELRIIYWDDAHHLEHLDVLKRALHQAAFFKINGFAIKLEGHFQYKSAAPIVEPYALTPSELQDLTDEALKYHIQLTPYLDGPAHDAFILKHPEYARLREYPESNYEFCATNPETYNLLFGMFQDLLDANRGSKYFVFSTDEPYYIGLAKNAQCNEADRAQHLGSVGKLLAEFVTKTAGYLHDRGRTVIFWGEYPLVPGDVSSLPSYLVNGELYGPQFDAVFKAHGIRQMVYTSTQGEEALFPEYYLLPPADLLHPKQQGPGRVWEMFQSISAPAQRARGPAPSARLVSGADVIGVLVAGWADAGLHPEAFWLGYATGPAAGWHPISPGPDELMSCFYRLFYGPGAIAMGRVYQLMSEEAQFWEDSWETVASAARTPLFGDSERVFDPPRPEHDQSLSQLPSLSPAYLQPSHDWSLENRERLDRAARFLAENEELLDLLHANIEEIEFNRYNLEVFLSIAHLYRQNLQMILGLGRMNDLLKSAAVAAGKLDASAAVEALDEALDLAESVRQQRNAALQDATATWYKSWFPRVAEANGGRYLDKVDDVKDHHPMRTVDMRYLIYRELLYPLGEWAARVQAARNTYAETHHLPVRERIVDWKKTED
jgi:hexosaminidase